MFVDNWKDILKKAWSVRLMLIAGLLSGIEVALPLIDGWIEVPPGVFASLSGIVTAAALVTRIMAQHNVKDEE